MKKIKKFANLILNTPIVLSPALILSSCNITSKDNQKPNEENNKKPENKTDIQPENNKKPEDKPNSNVKPEENSKPNINTNKHKEENNKKPEDNPNPKPENNTPTTINESKPIQLNEFIDEKYTSKFTGELLEKPFLAISNNTKLIKSEVDNIWFKKQSQALEKNFQSVFSKPIDQSNRNISNVDPAHNEHLMLWNRLISLIEGDNKDLKKDKSLTGIAKYNAEIFKNNYMYLTSLFTFFEAQTKNKMELSTNVNGVIAFDHTKQHYGFLYNHFLTKPNSFNEFVKFCEEFEKSFLNKNIYYVKQIISDVEKFIELQYRNRDLAFNPILDGFHFNIKHFDFINKAPNEAIRNLRQEIYENGGLYDKSYITKARQYMFNNPDWKKYEKYMSSFRRFHGIFVNDKLIKNIWLKINTTLLTGIYGYFNATAESNDGNELVMNGHPEVKSSTVIYRHKKSEWNNLRQYVIDSLPYIIAKHFTIEQAIRSLHNFIIWRMNYDFAKTAKEIKTRIPDLSMRNPAVYSLTPEKNKKVLGVCETYARVMSLFATFLNMNIIYNTGDINYYESNMSLYSTLPFKKTNAVEPHAWNMYYSKKENKAYFLDLTWDDTNDKNLDLEPTTNIFNNSDAIPFKYTYYLKDWIDFATMKDFITGENVVNKNKTQIIRSLDPQFYFASEWFKQHNKDRNDCFIPIPPLKDQHEWNTKR
ncbi:Mbov_0119 family protein [Mycoplasmopsis primatum]|uniref:Mbov_0119 family protein n=1 Tax=Mycoplasmopsis primatum TaxID=55604 RepID=UPI0004968FB4|nr:hypothetical protein [Mycoplasmopsis primatum]